MKTYFAALLLLASPLVLSAQNPADSAVEMDFVNAAQSPSHWTLTVYADGRAHFVSEPGSAPSDTPHAANLPALNMDAQLSARFAESLFNAAHHHHLFREKCESGAKVAFLGQKTLRYRGPEGSGSCTFNFAKDKEIADAGDHLQAAVTTLLCGARLKILLQHDRLGLDAETDSMMTAFAEERILQLGAIREVLQELADDPRVLERVHRRARTLLEKAAQE